MNVIFRDAFIEFQPENAQDAAYLEKVLGMPYEKIIEKYKTETSKDRTSEVKVQVEWRPGGFVAGAGQRVVCIGILPFFHPNSF